MRVKLAKLNLSTGFRFVFFEYFLGIFVLLLNMGYLGSFVIKNVGSLIY